MSSQLSTKPHAFIPSPQKDEDQMLSWSTCSDFWKGIKDKQVIRPYFFVADIHIKTSETSIGAVFKIANIEQIFILVNILHAAYVCS